MPLVMHHYPRIDSRKVQGLTKFIGEESSSTNIEDAIMVGDPILVFQKEIELTSVHGIERGGKKVKFLNVQEFSDNNVVITVKLMMILIEDNRYVWSGELAGSEFSVPGPKSFLICPTLSEINGKSTFTFNRQMIIDLGVGIKTNNTNNSDNSTVVVNQGKLNVTHNCLICKKSVVLSSMRYHVGTHMLKKEIEPSSNICGFCGLTSCSNRRKITSRKGINVYCKLESNCT